MFEILKLLRDLNEACIEHGTSMRWDNTDGEGGLALRAFIPLTEDDFTFIEMMRLMFAPKEDA